MLKEVEQTGLGIQLSSGKTVGGMLFADDYVLISASKESLRKLIDVVYNYVVTVVHCKWRLGANVSKGLFTSNSLQCALKRIRIECASNPDSIHFGTFHTTKMQCALSNRIITQSALCVLYIESNSVSQHGDAPGYFKIMLFFALASLGCITNTNWRENKENIWRR